MAFSAPLWKKGDIRYQLALAGGATMDMGCYPVSLLRLLTPGPRVISAEAKLSSPGVDRAMDAHFSLPDGGSAHIGCSMFSSSLLRLHAEVTGDNGKISVFNPFSPQYGHRMKVTTSLGTRKERFSRKASLRLPARGVRGRRRGGGLLPDHGGRRDTYDGAHRRDLHLRRPPRAPAHPSRLMPLAADELAALADAALDAAAGGCQAAELRVERIRSQTVRLRDAHPETTADDTDFGMGVRIVADGAVGFAATVDVRPEEAANLVRRAREMARVTSRAGGGRVELAPEPSHGEVTWSSAFGVDPSTVPLADKVALLAEWSERLGAHAAVSHTSAALLAVSEQTYLADLNGTRATQHRVRMQTQLEALALSDAGFETMRTLAPPVGRGWEFLTAPASAGGWDWDAELAELPELLAEKLPAPSVQAGTYDLVVDPSNLWLTIHESIGHATELDRAVGYEAAYAGTSFATFDKLGSLAYGSPVMHVTGDRTVEHGLATVGIDDEGVAAQSFDLVRDGTLVGYQLDRSIAAAMGFDRSNGCAFADSPMHVPDSAHGERVAGAFGRRGPEHRGADRRRGPRHLHRRRQELVDRHAALQLPVHRAALLPDRGREAGRAGEGRRVPSHHDRLLGGHGGRGWRVHLGARRRVQLRQRPARSGGAGLARLPVRPGARGAGPQHARGVGPLSGSVAGG